MRILEVFRRQIWQRMPRKARRAVLFRAAAAAAPRPAASAAAKLPILVAGTFHTASGLGESARLCHDALRGAGLPVLGVDLTTALMQPADSPEFAFTDGAALSGSGTIILHVNSPLVPLAMLRLGRQLVAGKRIVGCWAWELPSMPRDWRYGVQFVHEIWVPSRFTANAVQAIATGHSVHVMPYPVAMQTPRPASLPRAAHHPFTVLTIFNTASSFGRKNPLAAIAAFRLAFGDDPRVRLVVKASNCEVFSPAYGLLSDAINGSNNIALINKTMSAQEICALYSQSDVYISLHRSEGFGLTLAEAMVRGIPVVATDWSGNVDFLAPETGLPVPFRLVPAEDPQGTYHHPHMLWAHADVEAAANALSRLRDDLMLRARLGDAAAQFGARAWSAQSYASLARQHLGL